MAIVFAIDKIERTYSGVIAIGAISAADETGVDTDRWLNAARLTPEEQTAFDQLCLRISGRLEGNNRDVIMPTGKEV